MSIFKGLDVFFFFLGGADYIRFFKLFVWFLVSSLGIFIEFYSVGWIFATFAVSSTVALP